MVVTPSGIIMLVKPVHSLKASLPMVVSLLGKVILVKLVQP